MYYFLVEELIEIHDSIVENLWWLKWIKDKQQLESILQHIQNDNYYPSIVDKSVHLFFWIIKFHCFNDGNKRSAIMSTKYFLENNWIFIEDFSTKLEDIAVWVAKWNLNKEYLEKYFETLFISFWYSTK